jgi:hypothetical protein
MSLITLVSLWFTRVEVSSVLDGEAFVIVAISANDARTVGCTLEVQIVYKGY